MKDAKRSTEKECELCELLHYKDCFSRKFLSIGREQSFAAMQGKFRLQTRFGVTGTGGTVYFYHSHQPSGGLL